MQPIPLVNLAIAFIPVFVVIVIIWRWDMGYKAFIYAIFRMIVQLLLIGYVLTYIFGTNSYSIVITILIIMLLAASWISLRTTSLPRKTLMLNAFFSIVIGGVAVLIIVTQGVLLIDPWYSPQYLFPLLGMVLGNTLNGISLALERFMDSLSVRRKEVEMLLSLGATSWEAAHDLIRDALRTSMIPTLNSMLVMGIVSLPGMMTGQILAGVSPGEAVRYQIMMIFVIASGAALGATLVVILAFRALFNSRHQLLLKRLRTVS